MNEARKKEMIEALNGSNLRTAAEDIIAAYEIAETLVFKCDRPEGTYGDPPHEGTILTIMDQMLRRAEIATIEAARASGIIPVGR